MSRRNKPRQVRAAITVLATGKSGLPWGRVPRGNKPRQGVLVTYEREIQTRRPNTENRHWATGA